MEAFIVTIVFMGSIMAAMAVGVIFSGRTLKGSCGGVGGADCLCESEGKPLGTCDLPSSSVVEEGQDGVQIYR